MKSKLVKCRCGIFFLPKKNPLLCLVCSFGEAEKKRKASRKANRRLEFDARHREALKAVKKAKSEEDEARAIDDLLDMELAHTPRTQKYGRLIVRKT